MQLPLSKPKETTEQEFSWTKETYMSSCCSKTSAVMGRTGIKYKQKGQFSQWVKTECALFFSGGLLGLERDRAAVPGWAAGPGGGGFVRAPGLGSGCGWCCYTWPVWAEVQKKTPLPHPGATTAQGPAGLCPHAGDGSFPAITWWGSQLNSLKWVEATCTHANVQPAIRQWFVLILQ